ncbi:MAG: hypothetical protein AVO33_03945 [delta proteobacterium ML8_F1]|nr:MAG: hypothetical protein AVO33_03945 [delta proteobacterium ML8_F1]
MSLKKKLVLVYILSMLIPLVIYMAVIGTIHQSLQEDYSEEIDFFLKSEEKDFEVLIEGYYEQAVAKEIGERQLLEELGLINEFSEVAFEVTRGEKVIMKSEDFEALMDLKEKALFTDTLVLEGGEITVRGVSPKPWDIADVRPPKPPLILWLMVGYGVMHLVFLSIFLRNTLKPLEAMKNAANHIVKGQFDYPLPLDREDEIGEVFEAFSEMQQALGEAQMLELQYEGQRRELIANISHDLRTPITAIQGYADGISDGVADTPEKIEKYLQIIRRYTRKMEKLVENLSTISRLDVSQISFKMEPVILYDYLRDCLREYEIQFSDRGIALELQFMADKQVRVEADRDQIRRVIDNVMENAQKFFDKSAKEIVIQVEPEEEWMIVSIADNGTGIPTDRLKRIFDRFYRVDEARSGQFSGSGIGLSIAKSIVENHGGEIWAQSDPGQWTKISFTLRRLP